MSSTCLGRRRVGLGCARTTFSGMNSIVTNRLRPLWRGTSWIDLSALAILIVCGTLWALQLGLPAAPQSFFFILACLFAFGYLSVRAFLWARQNLLWSLKNRLIVAYLFIAVVP